MSPLHDAPAVPTFALVTPSYAGDLERCRLLVESVERCVAGGIPHYLFVHRRDLPLFSPMENRRTRILCADEMAPWFDEPEVARSSGWIQQQICKLSVFDTIAEDVALFFDSDVVFVRPYDPRFRMMSGNRVKLLRVEHDDDNLRLWQSLCRRLLGWDHRPLPPMTYVGNGVAWRRENLRRLRAHVEASTGEPWWRSFARHPNISEYTLYGLFVEYVLGLEAAGHAASTEPMIHARWHPPVRTEDDVEAFLRELIPEHVGVMFHSKHDTPVALYRDRVRAFWDR